MLTLGERDVTLGDFQKVIFGEEKIIIASKARERVKKSSSFLESFYRGKLSSGNKRLSDEARQLVTRFEEDTVKYLEINEIKDYLCTRFIDILDQ